MKQAPRYMVWVKPDGVGKARVRRRVRPKAGWCAGFASKSFLDPAHGIHHRTFKVCLADPASVADAGVDEAVEGVDRKVQDHEHQG